MVHSAFASQMVIARRIQRASTENSSGVMARLVALCVELGGRGGDHRVTLTLLHKLEPLHDQLGSNILQGRRADILARRVQTTDDAKTVVRLSAHRALTPSAPAVSAARRARAEFSPRGAHRTAGR